ncbi:hypothetical protein LIER_10374 [Lithospermum erythrorhizon]|uniref:Uncharacterized protein n=1 Tax=Lithospermum erythrorhizon TaxID=34254 RepID=A0AAV3PN23_LITER
MGEEDGLRTVECLRGRLLAERLASRNAKDAAEQTENKLVELEAQLKEEIKSRKKAEKRLKLLMKKLRSLKILNPSNVFDESDHSCSFNKSEVTSVSSSVSCTSNRTEAMKVINQGLIENIKWSNISTSSKGQESIGDEETISSVGEGTLGENAQNSKADGQSLISSNEDHRDSGEDDEWTNDVNNSMALVPNDHPNTAEPTTDVGVLETTVKEVLDSLRHVKEEIQISKEQRRMVRV